MEIPVHRIEKTKNRTSRAHLDGAMIVIRLAHRMRKAEEQRHIEILLRRMAAMQTRLAKTPAIDPFRPLLQGESSLMLDINGRRIHFDVSPGNRTQARYDKDTWHIEKSSRIKETPFHRFLWKLISISELPGLSSLVHDINNQTYKLPIRRVGMRLTRSRWGSCSHSGSINLSSALLFVPEPLLEYVIVHELAHMLHPNHSRSFWDTVASVMPDYKERLKKLKHYRLPRL